MNNLTESRIIKYKDDVKTKILEAALEYCRLGWSVVPLVRGGKKPPAGITWKNRRYASADDCPDEKWKADHPNVQWGKADENQIWQWWKQFPDANVGVLTGSVSGIDSVDLDGPFALDTVEAQANITLPDSVSFSTGRVDTGKQIVFQYHGGGLKTWAKFCSNGNGSQADLRTDGGLFVAPPSIHESGIEYKWIVDPDIENPEPFPIELVKFIHSQMGNTPDGEKDKTKQRTDWDEWFQNGIPEGEKHHGGFRFCCKKISQGLSYDEIYILILEVMKRSDPPPREGPEAAAKKLLDEAWAKYGPEAAFDAFDNQETDWPDPEPIKPQMLPVEPLLESMIPSTLLPMIKDVSHRMSVPMDYVAIPLIITIGSVIGTGCHIKPKRKDDWSVVPNLWGGISGPPSRLKTPAMDEVISKTLGRLEFDESDKHKKTQSDWKSKQQAVAMKKDVLKTEYKKALKTERKKPLDAISSDEILQEINALNDAECPSERRYKVNDASIEKMVELLSKNAPRGLLYYRDELVGLFRKMDKPGHEQDRAFLIESWNGKGSHTDDRIGRGTVKADNLCVSLVGTIQPGRLVSYIRDALNQDANDGFSQRLQLMIHPDILPTQYVDEYPDNDAKTRVYEIIKHLAENDFSGEEFQNDDITELFEVF